MGAKRGDKVWIQRKWQIREITPMSPRPWERTCLTIIVNTPSLFVGRTVCEDGFQNNLGPGMDTHIFIQGKWLPEAGDDVMKDEPDISWEKRTPLQVITATPCRLTPVGNFLV